MADRQPILPGMFDDSTPTTHTNGVLVCIECGGEDDIGARGWRAYVFEAEVLVYCTECALREFDDTDELA
jgi:hypothetical protein